MCICLQGVTASTLDQAWSAVASSECRPIFHSLSIIPQVFSSPGPPGMKVTGLSFSSILVPSQTPTCSI